MNKNDLSKKWSKYCNTDKLVDDMMALLKKYKHRHSEHGVCTLLDTYFTQKEPLIKLFMTSNHYIGDMRICLKKEFERQISANEIGSFFCNIHDKLSSMQILKHVDGDGKKMVDYLMTGSKTLSLTNLPDKDSQEKKLKLLSRFRYHNAATVESDTELDTFVRYMNYFNGVYSSKIQNSYKCRSDIECPDIKAGTKTSRAFNAVCKFYGVDKFNPQKELVEKNGSLVERTVYPYDKVFAQYSDLVSDLKRKMNFVISLNPLDYLTMSFGVSWISCHNIQTGGWKGGCLSYMLDTTSMITYVVGDLEGKIHEIPKLYRQMYHYENNLFVQNRLYPQGNDGATDLYEKFRGFMVEEFSELLGVDGAWGCCVGPSYIKEHVVSTGAHYKDYNSRRDCSIFYPIKNANDIRRQVMTVGHSGICVNCGTEHTMCGYLSHQYSSDCVQF